MRNIDPHACGRKTGQEDPEPRRGGRYLRRHYSGCAAELQWENGASHFTTAGILLKDQFGDRFVTAASDGLPKSNEVMYLTHYGRYIGEIVVAYPYTV